MKTRLVRAGAVALALMLVGACATGHAIRAGDSAARRGDWDTAVAYYRQALGNDPGRIDVKVALERAMRYASGEHLKRARELEAQDQLPGAAAEYRLAADLDPGNTLASTKANELSRRLRELSEAARPPARIEQLRQQAAQAGVVPKLDPRTRVTVQWNGTVRDLLNFIGQTTGIGVQFDQTANAQLGVAYQVTFQDTSIEDALNQALTANRLSYKVLNPKTIFIFQDTPQNHTLYDDQYVQTFYLSNGDATELNQLLNQILAQQTTIVRPIIYPNKTANALVVKATGPVMQVIGNIIAANDKPRAEVIVDVEILEVDRTRVKKLGLDLNQWALGLTFSPELAPPNTAGTFPPATAPPFNLNTISQGVSAADFYATVPASQIQLLESDQKTKLLARPQLRGREGATLTLNLGDDIPYPQTTFGSAAAGGIATIPQTSFQYRRVGVNLSMVPRVTYSDEIILENFQVEKSGLGASINIAGQDYPSFVSRIANVTMRLRDGESNLLAGLLRQEDRKTLTSFPGILHIPILRSLFGNTDAQIDESDIVMIVTPHIVRSHELTSDDLKPMYVGTGQNFGAAGPPPLISPEAPPLTTPPAGQPGAPAPAQPPGATPPAGQMTVGVPTAPTGPRPGVTVVPVQPVGGAGAPTGQPPTIAQVVVTVPQTEYQAGQLLTVPITITNVSQLSSVSLTVSYSPAVIGNPAVTQGTFMQQGGVTTAFAPKIDNATGRIDIVISRTGDTVGVNGTGLLAGISFRALAAGSSPIGISGVATTPTGQSIPVQFTPGAVTVR